MKTYGFEEGVDGPSLALSQVTLAVMPDELRCLARFFQKTAETMEKWGEGFDHEHFRDFCDENGITSIEGASDVIIAWPLNAEPKGTGGGQEDQD